MPELSGFGKYVRFVHTENLIHNPDQQISYSVKGANRPAVSGPRHPQMRVVRAVPGPEEGHHDFGRKHSDGKPGHRPSYAIQHVCELEERGESWSRPARWIHMAGVRAPCCRSPRP